MYAGGTYPDCGRTFAITSSEPEAVPGGHFSDGSVHGDAVAAMHRGVRGLLRECEAADATLWFLLEVPYQPAAARQGILAVQWRGVEPSFTGVDRATHAARTALVREALAGCPSPRLRLVDLAEPLFGSDGVSRVGAEGRFWYWDQNHVNSTAARGVLAPVLRSMLEVIAADCAGRPEQLELHER